jgi:hypothetical protein
VVLLYLGTWVTSEGRRACMHKVIFWILKRSDDEDLDVPQQYGAWADKRRRGMTEVQTKWCQAARQSSELKWEDRNCREMPGAAGLQRVLEESLGTLVQALVCAMRARPAAACGRGPCLFRAQACRRRAGSMACAL